MVYSHLGREEAVGSLILLLKIVKDWLKCKAFFNK